MFQREMLRARINVDRHRRQRSCRMYC